MTTTDDELRAALARFCRLDADLHLAVTDLIAAITRCQEQYATPPPAPPVPEPAPGGPAYYSVPDLAREWHVSKATIYGLLDRGVLTELPREELHRRIVDGDSVRAYRARHTNGVTA